MATSTISARGRSYRILRLFFGLVLDFFLQYLRARLTGRSYNFFADVERNRRRAVRIRTTALEMGGVLIKVGQFLSSRVDLLPPEFIEELTLLQDEVPGVSFDEIRQVVEQEFGRPIQATFAYFDPASIAAASLGQVHAAVLPTGQQVAVKVQRPHIREIVDADLRALRYIVLWLDRHTAIGRRANLQQVMREFEETLAMEMDYIREGHHAERFAVAFARSAEIVIPRIYWSHSTPRVLTMQFMAGTKVTDFGALSALGIDRSVVAEELMRAYLKQILEDGFFHADPHPGNIFVRPGPRIVLLDFGMVGRISDQMRDNLRAVFIGIVRRDFDDVLDALVRLGFIGFDADMASLKRALIWTVDTFYEMSFAELKNVDPMYVLNQLQDVLYAESFQIPANFAFLGRALGTLSGLCTALDPTFQFVTVAEPFGRDLMRRRQGVLGAVSQAAAEARSLAVTAYSLPYLTHDVLRRAHRGELGLRREFDEVVHAVEGLQRAMRRLLHGMLVTGFVVAGAFVFSKHYALFAIAAFVAALIFLIGAFAPIRGRK